MKAIVYEKYGPPEVLHLEEVEKPVPGESEVLVKIQAASVNYGDAVLVRGKPLVGRLWSGLLAPKHRILGTDISGQVEAVGRNARQFRPGDEVFGDIGDCGFGAFAQYVAVPEKAMAPKPVNITFEEAAVVPQAAVVALQGLRNKGQIQQGHKVLVNGASGGIGTFAIQIARGLGAEVAGVCSTRNMDLVRSIGAHQVVDYTREDFAQNGGQYDLIFDIVANRSVSDYLRALNPGGIYVACAFNPSAMFLGAFMSKKDGKRVTSFYQKPNVEDLIFIKELIEAGKVKPVIDQRYPLPEVPEAMRYLEAGRGYGKIAITIHHDDA
jgi:NADPH:quinone reductase-like Zn-dependent oxidoreductase